MDVTSETYNGTSWLSNPLTSLYQELSPIRQNDCSFINTEHQDSVEYSNLNSMSWQNKRSPLKQSPDSEGQIHSNNGLSSPPSLQEHQSILKKRSGEPLYHVTELEKKQPRKQGYAGSNGSGQGWSQVEELAEHLAADFDGSLSAIAASDLANAVASYSMSEALLALPSLTIFKQEVPSPENQRKNLNLNQSSQRNISSGISTVIHGNVDISQADSDNANNNNNNNNSNGSNTNERATTNFQQLLYSSKEEYPPTSTSANHVSSSQGTEFNEDCRFQYVLAAATSTATKINEETLTYLNQGQPYEIKLKKLGDLSAYRGKMLKSTIRLCFHERRLQYTEREQILAWQRARPGERLLEVDVPLSYGMLDPLQPSSSNNTVEFIWDPTKEVGVYIKINCISTEFTPKKHGGEKGVPFRIQVETRLCGGPRLHVASCQIKVFKLKGADRKHKQDRDKILRRPLHEQEKYQPSYDCTVLSDISLDTLSAPTLQSNIGSPHSPVESNLQKNTTPIGGNTSPVSTSAIGLAVTSSSVLSTGSVSDVKAEDSNVISATLPSPVAVTPDQSCFATNNVSCLTELPPDANVTQTSSWLRAARFQAFESTFANFSAPDILRLSRDDLIQICGVPDGIRLYNALHVKSKPKLTLYFTMQDNTSPWRVIYLDNLTSISLVGKLTSLLNLPYDDRLHSVLLLGPQGIHVLVTNELVVNMKNDSMFYVEIIKDTNSQQYKILLKPSSH